MAEPRRPTDRFTYFAYRTAAEIAARTPGVVGEPAARSLGRALSFAQPGKRRIVRRNLERVWGGRRGEVTTQRAVAAAFESYGRYWLELFRLPSHPDRMLEGWSIEGFEHVEAGIAGGRGTVVALPHLGGWETAGLWVTLQGHGLSVVVEKVEPPELFEWFTDVRESLGMHVIPLDPDVATRALKALADNSVLCLLCDRDLTGDGVEVEFFGETTTLPGGPALLALRTGAPLLPTAVYFAPRGGHHAVVRPPLDATRHGKLRDDVADLTQRLAHELEELIGEAPEQWHLMQPNWPSDHKTPNPTRRAPFRLPFRVR